VFIIFIGFIASVKNERIHAEATSAPIHIDPSQARRSPAHDDDDRSCTFLVYFRDARVTFMTTTPVKGPHNKNPNTT